MCHRGRISDCEVKGPENLYFWGNSCPPPKLEMWHPRTETSGQTRSFLTFLPWPRPCRSSSLFKKHQCFPTSALASLSGVCIYMWGPLSAPSLLSSRQEDSDLLFCGETWAWPRTSLQVEPSPAHTPQLSSLAWLPSCRSQPTACRQKDPAEWAKPVPMAQVSGQPQMGPWVLFPHPSCMYAHC